MIEYQWFRLGPLLPLLLASVGCAMDVGSVPQSSGPENDIGSAEQPLPAAGVDLQTGSSNDRGIDNQQPVFFPDFSVERIEAGECKVVYEQATIGSIVGRVTGAHAVPGVAVTVANHGKWAKRVDVDFFFGLSSAPTDATASDADKPSPVLEADETSTMMFYVEDPAAQNQRERIDVVLDRDDSVTETNEGNNYRTAEVTLPECPAVNVGKDPWSIALDGTL